MSDPIVKWAEGQAYYRKGKRQALALQVLEHIKRYHPEFDDVVVEISPCGTSAVVRRASRRES